MNSVFVAAISIWQYLLPDNPIALAIVGMLIFIFILWCLGLIRYGFWLWTTRKEMNKCEDIETLVKARQGCLVGEEANIQIVERPKKIQNDLADAEAEQAPHRVVRNPKDGAEMVLMPAGEFLMGSDKSKDNLADDDELPQRKVYLDGYWIYKYEVTVAQYRKFCQETGKQMPEEPSWGWQDEHPIANVTWDDAVAYCQWAGVELPTEAQWEKAARGTDGRIYPWGNEWDASRCNNKTTGPGLTTAVSSYPAGGSPYGVMDMAGNVWEWCADWYDKKYYASAPDRNPSGPTSGTKRVLRGGSWVIGSPIYLRAADRYGVSPEVSYSFYGFRGVALRFPR
ncbi:formylglycine-generating enzyme family protein [Candidatus Poribacteria bacterium]|nr:formylglycine-generating enzyme family protein [Candidatus Poribacteria bacterium]